MYKPITVKEIINKKLNHPCGDKNSLTSNEKFMDMFFDSIVVDEDEEEDYFMKIKLKQVFPEQILDLEKMAFSFLKKSDWEDFEEYVECEYDNLEETIKEENYANKKEYRCAIENVVIEHMSYNELIGSIFGWLTGMRFESNDCDDELMFESE